MAADLRVSLKNLAASQLPEFVRAEYPTFVAFVEAYYEFLDNQSVDMENVRDIDTTLDEYIKYFKAELAHNYPVVSTDTERERFLLKHIKEQYLAKGSEASYKLLFRLLYGKDVFIDYPGRNMLRVSDGRWTQDVSIFVQVGQGDPNTLVGKNISIQTGKKIYNTAVVEGADAFSGVTASVQKVVVVNEALNIWELYLDRNFYGDISPNNTVKYGSKFQATILPNTAKIKINDPGKGFRPGQVFQLNTGEGTPFWFKVATVTETGGLKTIDVIKFGLFYNTSFSVTVLPTSAVTSKKKRNTVVSDLTYTVTSNGKVVDYKILTSGQNYQEAPLVEITGDGTGAAAHAVIVDGKITEIVVDDMGEGYTEVYAQITNAPGDVVGAGGSVKAVIGSDYDYKFNDKTSGFTESGYLNMGDYWDVSESGRFAAATATLGSGLMTGQIAGIAVTNGGSGYKYNKPTIDIAVPLDSHGVPIVGGVKATAEAIVENGVITGVTIINRGSGYISTPLVKIIGTYGYANGGYVGTIARQFFINAADTQGSDPAILNVSLDAVSKYPGYYKTNDGFLDDSMMIQDSYYFQAFAYVLKIDEQLQKYASVVRSMLHPSGMAMFGEYSINNKIDLSVGLTSLVKSLGVTLYDSVIASDDYELDSNGNVIRGTFYSCYKYVEEAYGTGSTSYDSLTNYYYPLPDQGVRWTENTPFSLNTVVFYEGNLYRVTQGGVSAADEVVYNSTTGSRVVFSHPPTNSTTGSSEINGSLVLLNIGRYDGFADWTKFNTTKTFGHGTPWSATTPVILNQFIYSGNNYYYVVTDGITGSSAPSHTTGTVANGTASLQYLGTKSTTTGTAADYASLVAKLWVANTPVILKSVIYHENNKYLVTTAGTTGNTGPVAEPGNQLNGTCYLQYIGTDVVLNTDPQVQTATYTGLIGDPASSAYPSELFTKVFTKAIGATGQGETLFMTDTQKYSFTKSIAASDSPVSLVEVFAKILTTKSFTDFAPIGEQHAIAFTLNTIVDPTSGVYPETGYIVLNPYDEGSYQAEHYSNTRDSTFST